MSDYPRCWIDADKQRYVYISDRSAWATPRDDLNGEPKFFTGIFAIAQRRGIHGGREYSHEEFLRLCDGEPIADKLREILKEKKRKDAIKFVDDFIKDSGQQPETLAEKRASKSWKVDDIIRAPAYSGGYRVWRVIGIFHGGEKQESVIEIETLDRIANTEGRMLVPAEMLDWNWLATHGIKETT